MVTQKELSEYPYLEPRIKRLSEEIQELRSSQSYCGTVLVNSGSPAYYHHEQALVGKDKPTLDRLEVKKQQRDHAIELKNTIESFIEAIDDIRLQEIFTRRFMYGESYKDVATTLGYPETENSIRMAIVRFFN